MNGWQTETSPTFSGDGLLIGRIAAAGRVVFIPSPRETGVKIHSIEARRAAAIAASIATASGENFTAKTVGIITPFRAQITEIIRALPVELQQITVDTVERYQGSERDVIILSLAVNFPAQLKAIQSLVELDGHIIDRKLNVAITRARQQIIILGCEEVLRESAVYTILLDKCIRWEWEGSDDSFVEVV
jgi:DNA replication ATP-dependent helicase Dna2